MKCVKCGYIYDGNDDVLNCPKCGYSYSGNEEGLSNKSKVAAAIGGVAGAAAGIASLAAKNGGIDVLATEKSESAENNVFQSVEENLVDSENLINNEGSVDGTILDDQTTENIEDTKDSFVSDGGLNSDAFDDSNKDNSKLNMPETNEEYAGNNSQINEATDNNGKENTINENDSEENVTDDNKTEENTTNESDSEENVTDDNKTDEDTTNENDSEENVTDDNKTEENTTNENDSEENVTDDNKTDEDTTNENDSEENVTDDNKTDENTTNENDSEENVTDDNKTEENTTNENDSEENVTDDNKTEENTTNENDSEENVTDNKTEENTTNENDSEENVTDDNKTEENTTNENNGEENVTDNKTEENTTNNQQQVQRRKPNENGMMEGWATDLAEYDENGNPIPNEFENGEIYISLVALETAIGMFGTGDAIFSVKEGSGYNDIYTATEEHQDVASLVSSLFTQYESFDRPKGISKPPQPTADVNSLLKNVFNFDPNNTFNLNGGSQGGFVVDLKQRLLSLRESLINNFGSNDRNYEIEVGLEFNQNLINGEGKINQSYLDKLSELGFDISTVNETVMGQVGDYFQDEYEDIKYGRMNYSDSYLFRLSGDSSLTRNDMLKKYSDFGDQIALMMTMLSMGVGGVSYLDLSSGNIDGQTFEQFIDGNVNDGLYCYKNGKLAPSEKSPSQIQLEQMVFYENLMKENRTEDDEKILNNLATYSNYYLRHFNYDVSPDDYVYQMMQTAVQVEVFVGENQFDAVGNPIPVGTYRTAEDRTEGAGENGFTVPGRTDFGEKVFNIFGKIVDARDTSSDRIENNLFEESFWLNRELYEYVSPNFIGSTSLVNDIMTEDGFKDGFFEEYNVPEINTLDLTDDFQLITAIVNMTTDENGNNKIFEMDIKYDDDGNIIECKVATDANGNPIYLNGMNQDDYAAVYLMAQAQINTNTYTDLLDRMQLFSVLYDDFNTKITGAKYIDSNGDGSLEKYNTYLTANDLYEMVASGEITTAELLRPGSVQIYDTLYEWPGGKYSSDLDYYLTQKEFTAFSDSILGNKEYNLKMDIMYENAFNQSCMVEVSTAKQESTKSWWEGVLGLFSASQMMQSAGDMALYSAISGDTTMMDSMYSMADDMYEQANASFDESDMWKNRSLLLNDMQVISTEKLNELNNEWLNIIPQYSNFSELSMNYSIPGISIDGKYGALTSEDKELIEKYVEEELLKSSPELVEEKKANGTYDKYLAEAVDNQEALIILQQMAEGKTVDLNNCSPMVKELVNNFGFIGNINGELDKNLAIAGLQYTLNRDGMVDFVSKMNNLSNMGLTLEAQRISDEILTNMSELCYDKVSNFLAESGMLGDSEFAETVDLLLKGSTAIMSGCEYVFESVLLPAYWGVKGFEEGLWNAVLSIPELCGVDLKTTDGVFASLLGNYGTRNMRDVVFSNMMAGVREQGDFGVATSYVMQASQSVGNMAIPMVVSAIPLPGFRALGTALMGISAYGNTFEQCIMDGTAKGTAFFYSLIGAVAECTLERYLGKMPFIGNLSKGVGNGIVKAITAGIGDALGEANEEMLQTILDPVFLEVSKSLSYGVEELLGINASDGDKGVLNIFSDPDYMNRMASEFDVQAVIDAGIVAMISSGLSKAGVSGVSTIGQTNVGTAINLSLIKATTLAQAGVPAAEITRIVNADIMSIMKSEIDINSLANQMKADPGFESQYNSWLSSLSNGNLMSEFSIDNYAFMLASEQLTNTASTIQAKTDGYNIKLDNLQQELANQQATLEQMKSDDSTSQKDIDKQQTKIDETMSKINDSANELQRLMNQLENLNNDVNNNINNNNQKINELTDLVQKAETALEDPNLTDAEVEALNSSISDAKNTINTLYNQNVNEMNKLTYTPDAAESRVSSLTERLNNLNNQSIVIDQTSHNKKIAEVEAELGKAKNTLGESLARAKDSLIKDLNTINETIDNASYDTPNLENIRNGLQEQVATIDARIESLRNEGVTVRDPNVVEITTDVTANIGVKEGIVHYVSTVGLVVAPGASTVGDLVTGIKQYITSLQNQLSGAPDADIEVDNGVDAETGQIKTKADIEQEIKHNQEIEKNILGVMGEYNIDSNSPLQQFLEEMNEEILRYEMSKFDQESAIKDFETNMANNIQDVTAAHLVAEINKLISGINAINYSSKSFDVKLSQMVESINIGFESLMGKIDFEKTFDGISSLFNKLQLSNEQKTALQEKFNNVQSVFSNLITKIKNIDFTINTEKLSQVKVEFNKLGELIKSLKDSFLEQIKSYRDNQNKVLEDINNSIVDADFEVVETVGVISKLVDYINQQISNIHQSLSTIDDLYKLDGIDNNFSKLLNAFRINIDFNKIVSDFKSSKFGFDVFKDKLNRFGNEFKSFIETYYYMDAEIFESVDTSAGTTNTNGLVSLFRGSIVSGLETAFKGLSESISKLFIESDAKKFEFITSLNNLKVKFQDLVANLNVNLNTENVLNIKLAFEKIIKNLVNHVNSLNKGVTVLDMNGNIAIDNSSDAKVDTNVQVEIFEDVKEVDNDSNIEFIEDIISDVDDNIEIIETNTDLSQENNGDIDTKEFEILELSDLSQDSSFEEVLKDFEIVELSDLDNLPSFDDIPIDNLLDKLGLIEEVMSIKNDLGQIDLSKAESSGLIDIDRIPSKDISGFSSKNWIKTKDGYILFKQTTDGTYESIGEILASNLANALGVEAAQYEMANLDGKNGVVSVDFTNGTEFISGIELLTTLKSEFSIVQDLFNSLVNEYSKSTDIDMKKSLISEFIEFSKMINGLPSELVSLIESIDINSITSENVNSIFEQLNQSLNQLFNNYEDSINNIKNGNYDILDIINMLDVHTSVSGIDYSNRTQVIESLVKMYVFDSITSPTSRTINDMGILFDKKSNTIKIAPIFDNSSIFGLNNEISSLEQLINNFDGKSITEDTISKIKSLFDNSDSTIKEAIENIINNFDNLNLNSIFETVQQNNINISQNIKDYISSIIETNLNEIKIALNMGNNSNIEFEEVSTESTDVVDDIVETLNDNNESSVYDVLSDLLIHDKSVESIVKAIESFISSGKIGIYDLLNLTGSDIFSGNKSLLSEVLETIISNNQVLRTELYSEIRMELSNLSSSYIGIGLNISDADIEILTESLLGKNFVENGYGSQDWVRFKEILEPYVKQKIKDAVVVGKSPVLWTKVNPTSLSSDYITIENSTFNEDSLYMLQMIFPNWFDGQSQIGNLGLETLWGHMSEIYANAIIEASVTDYIKLEYNDLSSGFGNLFLGVELPALLKSGKFNTLGAFSQATQSEVLIDLKLMSQVYNYMTNNGMESLLTPQKLSSWMNDLINGITPSDYLQVISANQSIVSNVESVTTTTQMKTMDFKSYSYNLDLFNSTFSQATQAWVSSLTKLERSYIANYTGEAIISPGNYRSVNAILRGQFTKDSTELKFYGAYGGGAATYTISEFVTHYESDILKYYFNEFGTSPYNDFGGSKTDVLYQAYLAYQTRAAEIIIQGISKFKQPVRREGMLLYRVQGIASISKQYGFTANQSAEEIYKALTTYPNGSKREQFVFDSFTSTSINDNSDGYYNGNKVYFKIKCDESVEFADVMQVSEFGSGEGELLLNAGQYFRIESVEKNSVGNIVINLAPYNVTGNTVDATTLNITENTSMTDPIVSALNYLNSGDYNAINGLNLTEVQQEVFFNEALKNGYHYNVAKMASHFQKAADALIKIGNFSFLQNTDIDNDIIYSTILQIGNVYGVNKVNDILNTFMTSSKQKEFFIELLKQNKGYIVSDLATSNAMAARTMLEVGNYSFLTNSNTNTFILLDSIDYLKSIGKLSALDGIYVSNSQFAYSLFMNGVNFTYSNDAKFKNELYSMLMNNLILKQGNKFTAAKAIKLINSMGYQNNVVKITNIEQLLGAIINNFSSYVIDESISQNAIQIMKKVIAQESLVDSIQIINGFAVNNINYLSELFNSNIPVDIKIKLLGNLPSSIISNIKLDLSSSAEIYNYLSYTSFDKVECCNLLGLNSNDGNNYFIAIKHVSELIKLSSRELISIFKNNNPSSYEYIQAINTLRQYKLSYAHMTIEDIVKDVTSHYGNAQIKLYELGIDRIQTISYNGININIYCGNPGNLSTALNRVKHITKLIDSLPAVLKTSIKELNVYDTRNPLDEYWACEYDNDINSGFKSAATGGFGQVNIWDYTPQVDTIAHELGHCLDSKIFEHLYGYKGYITRENGDWANAIAADGNSVSSYGDNDIVEDLAESVSLYITNPSKFFKKYPNRAKVLMDMFNQYLENELGFESSMTRRQVNKRLLELGFDSDFIKSYIQQGYTIFDIKNAWFRTLMTNETFESAITTARSTNNTSGLLSKLFGKKSSIVHISDTSQGIIIDNSLLNITYNQCVNSLDNAFSTMINKFGYQETIARFNEYVATGNIKLITRTNDARKIIQSIPVEYVKIYLSNIGNISQTQKLAPKQIESIDIDFDGIADVIKVNEINEDIITSINESTESVIIFDEDIDITSDLLSKLNDNIQIVYGESKYIYGKNELLKIISTVNEIISNVNSQFTKTETIKFIYDYLIKNYSFDTIGNPDLNTLVTGKGTNASFTEIFYEILDKLDIQGVSVEILKGLDVDGNEIMFNAVRVDGITYLVDATSFGNINPKDIKLLSESILFDSIDENDIFIASKIAELIDVTNETGMNLHEAGVQTVNETSIITPELQIQADKLAKSLFDKASSIESSVTSDMQSFAVNGSKLIGLEHCLKSIESLSRKILSVHLMSLKTANVKTLESIASSEIADSIRYTFVCEDATYVEQMKATIQGLVDKGYKLKVFRNTWHTKTYKGVNTNFIAPDGTVVEIQFHTESSYAVKGDLTHIYYEIIRNSFTTKEQKIIAGEIREAYQKLVSIPDGIVGLTEADVLPPSSTDGTGGSISKPSSVSVNNGKLSVLTSKLDFSNLGNLVNNSLDELCEFIKKVIPYNSKLLQETFIFDENNNILVKGKKGYNLINSFTGKKVSALISSVKDLINSFIKINNSDEGYDKLKNVLFTKINDNIRVLDFIIDARIQFDSQIIYRLLSILNLMKKYDSDTITNIFSYIMNNMNNDNFEETLIRLGSCLSEVQRVKFESNKELLNFIINNIDTLTEESVKTKIQDIKTVQYNESIAVNSSFVNDIIAKSGLAIDEINIDKVLGINLEQEISFSSLEKKALFIEYLVKTFNDFDSKNSSHTSKLFKELLDVFVKNNFGISAFPLESDEKVSNYVINELLVRYTGENLFTTKLSSKEISDLITNKIKMRIIEVTGVDNKTIIDKVAKYSYVYSISEFTQEKYILLYTFESIIGNDVRAHEICTNILNSSYTDLSDSFMTEFREILSHENVANEVDELYNKYVNLIKERNINKFNTTLNEYHINNPELVDQLYVNLSNQFDSFTSSETMMEIVINYLLNHEGIISSEDLNNIISQLISMQINGISNVDISEYNCKSYFEYFDSFIKNKFVLKDGSTLSAKIEQYNNGEISLDDLREFQKEIISNLSYKKDDNFFTFDETVLEHLFMFDITEGQNGGGHMTSSLMYPYGVNQEVASSSLIYLNDNSSTGYNKTFWPKSFSFSRIYDVCRKVFYNGISNSDDIRIINDSTGNYVYTMSLKDFPELFIGNSSVKDPSKVSINCIVSKNTGKIITMYINIA